VDELTEEAERTRQAAAESEGRARAADEEAAAARAAAAAARTEAAAARAEAEAAIEHFEEVRKSLHTPAVTPPSPRAHLHIST